MISPTMQDALSGQARSELASAYLYLAMAAHCAAKNFPGASHWLRIQHEEETEHAERIIDHIIERGGRARFGALEAPPAEFGSLGQVFEAILAHEREVTAAIHKLYEAALAEKDYATQVFLQGFIGEQVEEEASAQAIVERIKFVEERPGSVIYIDKELGKREKAGGGGSD